MPGEEGRGATRGVTTGPSTQSGTRSAASATRPSTGLPPQLTMGLLDYITSHSLDEDYAHAAERKAEHRSEHTERVRRSPLATLLVLGVFGLLIVTAAVQTARNASTQQSNHDQLVSQIKARGALVDARRAKATSLQNEIERLRTQFLDATAAGRSLASRLSTLETLTGDVQVTGPGVKVVVDDAPNATDASQRVLDKDLQRLANALWQSGAEAISINGQRLSNLSSIRGAGQAITVNYRSLNRPYVVLAIGNPNQMPARFLETEDGSAWLDLQKAYGLQFDMKSEESLTVPAAPRLTLRYASPLEKTR